MGDLSFAGGGAGVPIWLPPLAAFGLSYLSSMAGISGAVLLLPFQMSVLGFVSPAVSPTNLVFNIIAIPGGVYRYIRERRLVAPLAWVVIAGTTPGVILGELIRVAWFPDPGRFRIFAGCVMLGVGGRLLWDLPRSWRKAGRDEGGSLAGREWSVRVVEFNSRRVVYEFQGRTYSCKTLGVLLLSCAVGLIGGVYGIGGGAILAPFLVAIYGLPIHTVAGATLLGTFATSVVGVSFAALIAPVWEAGGVAIGPDWGLGGLFGVGGAAGIYLGARTQRYVPALALKLLLSAILMIVAANYLAPVSRP